MTRAILEKDVAYTSYHGEAKERNPRHLVRKTSGTQDGEKRSRWGTKQHVSSAATC